MSDDVRELAGYVNAVTARAVDGDSRAGRIGPIPEGDPHREVVDTYLRQADDVRIIGEAPTDVRLGWFKRLLLRLLKLVTRDQTAFNIALLTAVEAHVRSTDDARVTTDQRIAALEARLATLDDTIERVSSTTAQAASSLEASLDERTAAAERRLGEHLEARVRSARGQLEERVGGIGDRAIRLETAVGEARRALADAVSRAASDRTEVAMLRNRVEMLLKEARSRLPGPLEPDQISTFAEELAGRFDALYADLEEIFRGTQDDIRGRLRDYLPDIEALEHLGDAAVVDVGSGRGEWLDILQDAGVRAYGVDVNDTFVQRCRDRGLEVVHGDAIVHLASEVDQGSLKAVTGFHIIEHVSFENLIDLIDASLLALRPGGCVIFETPNPTNLIVGAATFYLDPTHRNPLHPRLTEFLLTSRGFVDVDVRFMHPPAGLRYELPDVDGLDEAEVRRLVDELNWALHGPMDYAVVGYKAPGAPDRP